MNFCVNCHHAEGDRSTPFTLKCANPKNGIATSDHAKYAVSGILQPTVNAALAANCIVMRQHTEHPYLKIEMCGPDGKWWEHV
jgi:hypothetical protein